MTIDNKVYITTFLLVLDPSYSSLCYFNFVKVTEIVGKATEMFWFLTSHCKIVSKGKLLTNMYQKIKTGHILNVLEGMYCMAFYFLQVWRASA